MEKLLKLSPEFQFSGRGEVYSFTVMYSAPSNYAEFTPYVIAHIKLEEGPMVTAQITDLDNINDVYIGMPVEHVTRLYYADGDRGLRRYGYKFRPVM